MDPVQVTVEPKHSSFDIHSVVVCTVRTEAGLGCSPVSVTRLLLLSFEFCWPLALRKSLLWWFNCCVIFNLSKWQSPLSTSVTSEPDLQLHQGSQRKTHKHTIIWERENLNMWCHIPCCQGKSPAQLLMLHSRQLVISPFVNSEMEKCQGMVLEM